jgi:hypothetical protein
MSMAALRDACPGWSSPAAAGGESQGDRDDRTERDGDAPGSIDERMRHVTVGSGYDGLGLLSIPAGDPEARPCEGPGAIRTFVLPRVLVVGAGVSCRVEAARTR